MDTEAVRRVARALDVRPVEDDLVAFLHPDDVRRVVRPDDGPVHRHGVPRPDDGFLALDRRERQRPANEGGRLHAAAANAIQPFVTGRNRGQLENRHVVTGGGERCCLAAHARVVLDRLVQQHADPHDTPSGEAPRITRRGGRASAGPRRGG